jgi:hypothetical protein
MLPAPSTACLPKVEIGSGLKARQNQEAPGIGIEGDDHVNPHTNGKLDIVLVEEIRPSGADELTVGEQVS